ncbi:beta-N-acetylhexosaminidase [Micromonospora sp. C28SCA-DRY-2]|uniref:beta-N-acetylhexosaminidase n=1 Tax=Micromonospora sp. C28SCA-DRY-2 TaxID=3059522 RepID=UPI002676A3E7|nr:beta-N-acetylhexosaminidase [Micromonospora sp. C28SCA-DRY-2]MDO3703250.1 beta-N-acetylhexosaminidase [Micromonospora sp. C28SCA-DRY-2]
MIVPRPSGVARRPGTFRIDPGTGLAAPPELDQVVAGLRAALGPPTGCWLPPQTDAAVRLRLDPALPGEGYRLSVAPDRLDLAGGSPAGVFYGTQTIRQLLPPAALRRARVGDGPWELPCVEMTDAPRFPWRGCLLDVARHFLPKADVLRFVDLLALHKFNVLHLHLTDDQGWRLASDRYPRLTEVGAWRAESMRGSRQHGAYDARPHGGFYTRDDLREIVAYAADRHVSVVPEVDLPGHTQAAIAAYPWLGNGAGELPVWTGWGRSTHVLNVSDAALRFCRDILDEVCELFPSPIVSIGGDECPKDEWRASAQAQARMRQLGLPDEDALQSWFVGQLAAHLAGRGRRVYGWDEIMEGGAPAGATIAAWRGPRMTRLAARAGLDVVSCPDMWAYLDYRQSEQEDEPIPVGTVLSTMDVYGFEPIPDGLTATEAARVIGAQCNVWTEHMDSARVVDYMAFPRLCAFAEVAWGFRDRDPADFRDRLGAHLARLEALGVEYRPPSGPRPWQTRPDAKGWPRTAAERRAQLAALTANLQPDR